MRCAQIVSLSVLVVSVAYVMGKTSEPTAPERTAKKVSDVPRKVYQKYPNARRSLEPRIEAQSKQVTVRASTALAARAERGMLDVIAKEMMQSKATSTERLQRFANLETRGLKLVGWNGEILDAARTNEGWKATVRFTPVVVRSSGGSATIAAASLEKWEFQRGQAVATEQVFQGSVDDVIFD